MEAELGWWEFLEDSLKTYGVSALATGATALTNCLRQLNGFAPARLAGAIAFMSAVVAESASKAVQDKKDQLRLRIKELKKEIDQEKWDLFWSIEGGVPGTAKPWLDFTPCIYKNFCNYSQVCVTNGTTGAKECGERTIACEERLVSCGSFHDIEPGYFTGMSHRHQRTEGTPQCDFTMAQSLSS